MTSDLIFGTFCGIIIGYAVVYFIFKQRVVSLDEQMQKEKEEKKIVFEFTHNLIEGIGEGISKKELYKRIVHGSITGTGALSACIYEISKNNELTPVAIEGLFPPQKEILKEKNEGERSKFIEKVLHPENIKIGEGIVGEVAKTKNSVLIENAKDDTRLVNHSDPALKLTSLIMVPIFCKKEVLGVLGVANPADGTYFNAMDLSLVQSLADQAGMAIHNLSLMAFQLEKNRIDFDLKLASSIQEMLLPKQRHFEFKNLEISAIYQAAHKVGGDLYEIIPLSDSRLAIAIADVSGKGISASLLMAICLTNLRHFALEHSSPLDVMRSLNSQLSPQLNKGMFVTMIYGIFDLNEKNFKFCRAGHENPLFIHKIENKENHLHSWTMIKNETDKKNITKEDFGIEESEDKKNNSVKTEEKKLLRNSNLGKPMIDQIYSLHSEGIAIGINEENVFNEILEEKTVSFQKDDIICLFTDGITESLNSYNEEFTMKRLAQVISQNSDSSAFEINKSISDSIKTFSNKNVFEDDVTCLCVKCKA